MKTVSQLYESRVAAGAIEADPAQRGVLPVLDALLVDLGRPPERSAGWRSWFSRDSASAPQTGSGGVYLWGDVGRGKSMLLDLTMEAAPIEAKRRVHFHAFMQEVQAGLEQARSRGDQDVVRPVAEGIAQQARLLCFDEMQITDIADAMIVGRLFQVLFERGVRIVTTSNRAPADLYKNGLNRDLFLPFIDLIQQRMDVCELASATDYRLDGEAGDQVWFTPPDENADAALDRIWAALTDGAAPEPGKITVGRRELSLAAKSGRIGRASFQDLCGQPLGPADYLALAEALDVLMIDRIPRLGRETFDKAKRFVTLIDTLYEAKVRLIASAEAVPDALYPEGEGSFEFRRTASRLAEMQEAGWGDAQG
ncbi:cell division protein ZapE [Paracoccus sp. TK19116]|uniref:Cell division protein ZapE n=1 Tax=Paracoccus albicereus TaxID=2922394 RepID=A0ABT1MWU1_9RHOB|nr:cell division protein ZapE [Paracoccus albicereus]MCQ0971341.1 cell division protein ZapE [Paracoccus albicereus]